MKNRSGFIAVAQERINHYESYSYTAGHSLEVARLNILEFYRKAIKYLER